MSKRTISISPQFFNISKSKKTKKIIPSEVNINAPNIRQLLLDKLKEHKKTKKIITDPSLVKNNTPLQNNTFDESCKEVEKELQKDMNPSKDIPTDIPIDIQKENTNTSPKPYGNLKNGVKPTYRVYQENTNLPPTMPQTVSPNLPLTVTPPLSSMTMTEPFEEPKIILEEKEVKKTFKLGKNNKMKTISILIKNNKTRKKVEDAKTEHKKTHVSTIKNYLKKKNLIKYGSTAPTKLLREMYETSELCGGISNENKDVLIHNFDK
jgi:hypothetical protein